MKSRINPVWMISRCFFGLSFAFLLGSSYSQDSLPSYSSGDSFAVVGSYSGGGFSTDETTTEAADEWCPGVGGPEDSGEQPDPYNPNKKPRKPGDDDDDDKDPPTDDPPDDGNPCDPGFYWCELDGACIPVWDQCYPEIFEEEDDCQEPNPDYFPSAPQCSSDCEDEEEDSSETSPDDSNVCDPCLDSISLSYSIGRDASGRKLGTLSFHHESYFDGFLSPASLSLNIEREGAVVLRNSDYSIRRILSDSQILDIEPIENGFEIRFFPGLRDLDTNLTEASVQIEREPVRTVTVMEVESESGSQQIQVADGYTNKKRHFLFTWDSREESWSLLKGQDEWYRKVLEEVNEEDGTTRKSLIQYDAEGEIVFNQTQTYRDFPFGRKIVEYEAEASGVVKRDEFHYYEDKEADGEAYGQVKSRLRHNGSWTNYLYDEEGRVQTVILPWKDSPPTFDLAKAQAESYGSRYLEPEEDYYFPMARLTEVNRSVLGVPVSRTFEVRSYLTGGGRVVLTERAHSPTASFGDELNLRSVSLYYPEVEAEAWSGKIRERHSEDGSIVRYTYTEGDYLGNGESLGAYVARFGGEFKVTESIRLGSKGSQGVPGKTIKSRSIRSPYGKVIQSELFVLVEGTVDEGKWQRLNWKVNQYDSRNRLVRVSDVTGTIHEYSYNDCCDKVEWERSADGTAISYVRDELNRVIAKEVRVPGREAVTTYYQYNHFGQKLETAVVAGELEQVTRYEYNGFGQLVATTGADGLTTRYVYDDASRVVTTILPDHATQAVSAFIDGRTSSLEGTSVVAQFYDYGVLKTNGTLWSETRAARPDSKRWSRSFQDGLSRNFYSEQPGYGEGVVLASMNRYDRQGRLLSSAQGWKQSSLLDGESDTEASEVTVVGSPTVYTYHPETGELLYSGQDRDRNQRLEPGKADIVSRSEARYEEREGEWYRVSRTYRYPQELAGKPYLVSESSNLVTGLGRFSDVPEEIPGLLVAESRVRQPGKTSGEWMEAISRSYRDRESGKTVMVSIDPANKEVRQTMTGRNAINIAEYVPGDDGELERCCETILEYDALGREVARVNPRTGKSSIEYDPETGQVVAEVDPEGRRSEYSYYPSGKKHAGKLAAIANAEGKKQFLSYNLRGQRTAVWGDTAQPIAFEYNEFGELDSMQTYQTLPDGTPSTEVEEGVITRWRYDEATGVLERKEYADGHGPTYHYSEAGLLKTRHWARNDESTPDAESKVATHYSYDPLTGALTDVSYSDQTDISYRYDSSGRLSEVTGPTGTRKFSYDLRGQVIAESVKLTVGEEQDPIEYRINRRYTSMGQPESVQLRSINPANMSLALKHHVDYRWNPHGQLASVKSIAGEFTYTYDKENPMLLTRMTGPTHRVETTYEPHRDLITSITNHVQLPSAGGASSTVPAADETAAPILPISIYTYQNDALGRRERISQGGSAFAGISFGENVVEVAYNDRSEVIGAVTRRGEDIVARHEYAYDGIGNRRSSENDVGGEQTSFLYEANQLNQYNTIIPGQPQSREQNLVYDLDGNLIEDNKNQYTWNDENRLVEVATNDGRKRVEFLYDFRGRRTVKREFKLKEITQSFELTGEYFYIYDDWNLLATIEADSMGEVTSEYLTWGRDLSASLQGAGGVGGLLAITGSNELQRYPVYDANGNIGQFLDQNGKVESAYAYDSFGNVISSSENEAKSNKWRFSTKPVEEVTGWSYYGLRYYMPSTGRWASRDPIQEQGGLNLYGFLGNDAIGKIDLLGLDELSTLQNRIRNAANENLSNSHPNAAKSLSHYVSASGSVLELDESWLIGLDAVKAAMDKNHDRVIEMMKSKSNIDVGEEEEFFDYWDALAYIGPDDQDGFATLNEFTVTTYVKLKVSRPSKNKNCIVMSAEMEHIVWDYYDFKGGVPFPIPSLGWVNGTDLNRLRGAGLASNFFQRGWLNSKIGGVRYKELLKDSYQFSRPGISEGNLGQDVYDGVLKEFGSAAERPPSSPPSGGGKGF